MAYQVPGSRPAGWYYDPEDPDRLRYWAGRAWTGRRRSRPAWELSSAEWVPVPPRVEPDDGCDGPVLEGPVRAAELPAIAAAVIGPRDLPRAGQGGSGGAQRSGHPPAAPAGPRPHQGRAPVPRPWVTSRRPITVIGLAAVIAMMVMVVGVGAVRPPAYPQWLLTDKAFIARANAACSATLPSLRGSTQAAMSPTGSGAPAPASVDAEAAGVVALAGRLASLPIKASDQGHVRSWLDGWRAWASDEHDYASYLRSHPAPPAGSSTAGSPPAGGLTDGTQMQALAQVEANAADHFASANGLTACTVSPHPANDNSVPPYA